MKYLILVFLLVISCKPTNTETKKEISKEVGSVIIPGPDPIIIRDTVFIPKTIVFTKQYDSLEIVIKKKNDSLFVERYRLERVKYYNGIAQRNPSQRKFLVGWINRAVK